MAIEKMTETHYLALYRKYRPQTFDDVCGRDAIVRTLKNQISSGRIGHSYLFCGTRGTGKTTIAKIFAKAVNCEHPVDGNPCGNCDTCLAISKDADLNVVEMDAASNNGVDDIRGIIDQVSYSPTQGRYRVFIIDEVHMLSTAAFNALLKTLEEPPAYAIFILATTEPNRLPITILSRCQRYDFGRLPVKVIEDRLRYVAGAEGLTVEDKALNYIARLADGSMRDGLSILDQCNAFNYGNACLTYDKTLEVLNAVDPEVFSRLFRCISSADDAGALSILDELLSKGREIVQFITDFIEYLRNVMLLKASEKLADKLDVSEDAREMLLSDARSAELTQIIRYIHVLSALTEQIRYSANRRILTEAALIRLCEPSMDITRNTQEQFDSLTERVRNLESLMADSRARIERLSRSGMISKEAYAQLTAGTDGGTAGGGFDSLLQGSFTAKDGPAANGGSSQADADGSGGRRKRQPVLPAAIPDEIRRVAAGWNSVIARMPAHMYYLKALLRMAKPSVAEDGSLMVVFESENAYLAFAEKDEKTAEHRELLEKYLAEEAGGSISVTYKLLDNGQKFTENYVDIRDLQKKIDMDITEE